MCHKKEVQEGESSCSVARKRKSVTNLYLAEFIRERSVGSYTELLAIVEEQRTAGQVHISEFLFKKKKEKVLRGIITKTWQMESAKVKLEAKASRIDTVKTYLTSDCAEGCFGQWLQCAKEVLLLNGIDIH